MYQAQANVRGTAVLESESCSSAGVIEETGTTTLATAAPSVTEGSQSQSSTNSSALSVSWEGVTSVNPTLSLLLRGRQRSLSYSSTAVPLTLHSNSIFCCENGQSL